MSEFALAGTRPAPAADARIRVMICDDSAVIRAAFSRLLDEPDIEIVSRVANGEQALAEIARREVDVAMLDIEMPVMDGLTALPLLLKARPGLRVIMASTLTTRGAEVTMRALRLGATDYLPKPSAADASGDLFRRDLLAKIRGVARSRAAAAGRMKAPPLVLARPRRAASQSPRLLAIGASTGGPQALFALIQALGPNLRVPVVLTQHMPATFTPILAEHITRLGGMPCAEAEDGMPILPGRITLAPGDRHLIVHGTPGALTARLSNGPMENFCRPAVDPMLRSVVATHRGRAMVVMLTGMGHDGLDGTRELVAAGGSAIAQDEASSVVWGMPGAIAKAGLCQAVLPLGAIAPRVLEMFGVAG